MDSSVNESFVSRTATRKEDPLLPTSNHNLAGSVFEIVRNKSHNRLADPTVDVMTFWCLGETVRNEPRLINGLVVATF